MINFIEKKITKLIVLILVFWGCSPNSSQVIVTPKEIDDPLVNPGRGFATTGLFNEDIHDRLHPLSGVIQKRWYWDVLEPVEGEIRFSMIDSVISKAAKNGQQLNIRIMCQNVEMHIPDWAMAQGIKPPYYDNPVFLEKQQNLIKAFADRYDGDSNIAFFDIGTVGQWGEWHTGSSDAEMPSDENVIKIIDFYLDNFKETPLVMLIGASKGPGLKYAIEKGAGWRADCWGDMGDKWRHMEDYYPEALASSNAFDAWEKAPVALETCWTMQEWYNQGWDLDYILSKALEWHATEVNNGTEQIPEEWWPKVREFEKKLGYRFVLKQLQYPSAVYTGENLDCSMTWENKGVAPIYQHYPLAFLFQSVSDSSKTYIIESKEDITKWMPGISQGKAKINIPENMPPEDYNFLIGLIDRKSKKPAIKLAIEGQTSEGWYPLGKIQILE